MIQVRRSSNIFVLFSDRVAIDLTAFFSGSVTVNPKTQVLGISLVTGKTAELTPAALDLFATIDSVSWHSKDEIFEKFNIDSLEFDRLLNHGFLISDGPDDFASGMREMDTRLDRANWNPHQALAYVMSRWSDTSELRETDAITEVLGDFDSLVSAYGSPPNHYHHVKSISRTPLPKAQAEGELFKTLLDRYTARVFKMDLPMPQEDLSRLLHFTFGAQAEIPLGKGFTVLRKTSPSGGALHPVEAYPLIMNVQGLECGIYHYSVENHSLDLIEAMSLTDARDFALRVTTGQDYFASADLLVILTGRYNRNFWKYRNHAKARRVVELDAGHLSQTFYLIATKLGYGPFMTAAIADHLIEEKLDLPYLEEGAIAVVGCGTSIENQERLI